MKPELWDLVININLSAAERVNDYLLENDGLNAMAALFVYHQLAVLLVTLVKPTMLHRKRV